MICLLGEFDYSKKHCYREANKVAVCLAKSGALKENKLVRDVFSLSSEVHGLYKMDWMGLTCICSI